MTARGARPRFPRIGWMTPHLMWRRGIDPHVLTVAGAALALPLDLEAWILAVFAGIGYHNLIFRPVKSAARLDHAYVRAALIFALGALLIQIANGSVPGDWRWVSYPAYYLAMLPIVLGFPLIRDPLRQLVIGVRIGIAILAVWAFGVMALHDARYGFGTNQANIAFAFSFMAIFSRITIAAPPRFLANRFVWFYLALIPVIATGTRAVLPVFGLALLLDLYRLASGRLDIGSVHPGRWAAIVAAAFVGAALTIFLMAPVIEDRVTATVKELQTLTDGAAPSPSAGGMSIRMAQWDAAIKVIADHTLLGVGGEETLPAILNHSDPVYHATLRQFRFAHNMILDEWMQRGLLGVLLAGSFFMFAFWRIFRRGTSSVRENVLLVFVLTVTFGSLHYIFLVDRNVALYALYFAVLVTSNHGWHPPFRRR